MSHQILRDAARQLDAAADQLDARGAHGAQAQAAAFNWQALIALLVQVIPQIISLFSQQSPTPAPAPAPQPVPPAPGKP